MRMTIFFHCNDGASGKENDDDDGVSGVRRKSAKRPGNLTTLG